MDPDAPVTVLKGLLATWKSVWSFAGRISSNSVHFIGSAGAVFGGTYAFAKRQSPLVFTVNSSVNSGLVGLTFFALREYVAGPALVHTMSWPTYARRRERLRIDATGHTTPLKSRPTASEMRTYKLIDTTIAGSLTGGVLNAWKRGPRGVVPGAVTAGIICTTAQFLWNELGVARIKYVSQSHQAALLEPHRPPERPRTFSEKLMDGLGVVLPVRKMSDEEYLQKLLREREEVERRLEVVQKDLETADEQKRQD